MVQRELQSAGDVGAWVVKGNSTQVWDYLAAKPWLKANKFGVYLHDWTISPGYRSQMITKGDLVILWITGKRDPGIYEIGRSSGPTRQVRGIEPKHLIDKSRRNKITDCVDFESARLSQFLPIAVIKADPTLIGCEKIRIPIGANPSYLSPNELIALGRLLRGRIPKSTAKRLGWSKYV